MARWRAAGAVGLATALLVVGCGAPGPPVGSDAAAGASDSARPAWPTESGVLGDHDSGAWWSAAAAVDLLPTGIEVTARGPFADLVVDGAGAAWLRGDWSLARVDPTTGESRVWDVGDDSAFAQTAGMWPAEGGGVWLQIRDRLRLFDGTRFARDIEVPPEALGGPGGAISELAAVGGKVWIASPVGLARFASGRWTWLGPDQLADVGSIAVDPSGTVWAAGGLGTPDGARRVVMWFDAGGAWGQAGGDGAPRLAHELLASPTRTVLARWARSLTSYDGRRWSSLPVLQLDLGAPDDVSTAVTDDGAIWVRGERGLARLGSGERWQSVLQAGGPGVRAIAASGGSLLALTDGATLLRFSPDGSHEILWQDDGPRLVATADGLAAADPDESPAPGDVLRPASVVAVSRTEAWAAARGYPRPFRLGSATWREVPVAGNPTGPDIVRATDGAIWVMTGSGLLRFAGTGPPTVQARITGRQVIPGFEGSVWVVPQWWYGWWYLSSPNPQGEVARPGLVHLTPDGSRTRIPLPAEVWDLASVVADPRGGAWMVLCRDAGQDPCASGGDLLHWADGRWNPVPHPGRITTLQGVTSDGSLRALLWREDATASELARYRNGAWASTPLPGTVDDLAEAPDGSLCGLQDGAGALFCVGTDGGLVRHMLSGVPGDLAIGGDGSVWISAPGGIGLLPVTAGS